MIYKKIPIDIDYKKFNVEHDDTKAYIMLYVKDSFPNDQNSLNRPMVLICPGGGFDHWSPREGEPVAHKFLSLGMNVAVLYYSLYPNEFPCQFMEAAYALNYLRDNAKEWDTNPEKIIAAGFSAGGYVAGGLGILCDQPELKDFVENGLKVSPEKIRPDGLMLGYSVLTSGEFAHKMSFKRLLGERYDELIESLSLEKRVNENTPNAFIWHTFSDGSVPMENSLLFADALRKNGVNFEMHIFPNGNHGLALGIKETDTKDGTHFQPEVAVWPELFKTWLDNLK